MDCVRDSQVQKEFEKWEGRLAREGLGVLEIEGYQGGQGIIRPGRKYACLEGKIMGTGDYPPGDPRRMSPSPYTAMAVETIAAVDNKDVVFEAGNKLITDLQIEKSEWQGVISGSLEGLMVDDLDEDDFVSDESVLDQLAVSMTATAKEAEIADRARGQVLGLDAKGRPLSGRQRVHLNVSQRNANRAARLAGKPEPHQTNPYITEVFEVAPEAGRAPLRCDFFKKEQGLPCAVRFGGNGPLSIVGQRKAEEIEDRDDDEVVRMSPIVPTMYYHPGRGPYEMTLVAANNSDITG